MHRATHSPFRSWCPKCVAGRGVRGGHGESREPRDDTPHINLDYCFIRRGLDGETSVPVLVVKVRRLNVMFAHVVPHKGGSHKDVVALIVKDLARCGFRGRVVIKGDQEPAIEDLIKEVARHRGRRRL